MRWAYLPNWRYQYYFISFNLHTHLQNKNKNKNKNKNNKNKTKQNKTKKLVPKKEEAKVMFGNSFYFLFSKTCFGEYKEKPIFLYC